MPDLRLPRHSTYLRLLKISLIAGALYDFVFAGMMFLAPELATQLLELQPPSEPYFLWLIAVLLTMLGWMYVLAAYDPMSYSGNIKVAIVGRTVGALVFVYAAQGRDDLWGLYVLAAGDLLFAVAHAVCWRAMRR